MVWNEIIGSYSLLHTHAHKHPTHPLKTSPKFPRPTFCCFVNNLSGSSCWYWWQWRDKEEEEFLFFCFFFAWRKNKRLAYNDSCYDLHVFVKFSKWQTTIKLAKHGSLHLYHWQDTVSKLTEGILKRKVNRVCKGGGGVVVGGRDTFTPSLVKPSYTSATTETSCWVLVIILVSFGRGALL